MDKVKCNHRHEYDGNQYDYCPQCEVIELAAEGNY